MCVCVCVCVWHHISVCVSILHSDRGNDECISKCKKKWLIWVCVIKKLSVWSSIVWFQELDLHHRERLGKVKVAVSWRNIPSVCSLTVWLLKRVCRAKLPAPTPCLTPHSSSCFTGSTVWGDGHPLSAASLRNVCACVYLLACVPTCMTSCICGEYTNGRAAPTSPPLTDCSAQSSSAGPQLAVCGLCAARVISSAWRLVPEVDKIWIPYWCCHIKWREHMTGTHAGDMQKHLFLHK